MKVLVTGGRNFSDIDKLIDVFEFIHKQVNITTIVHGAAKGTDSLADSWAEFKNILRKPYPANWNKYGKSAGIIRNRVMLFENPDIELVIAFPGGAGTNDMIKISLQKRLPVIYSNDILT